MTKRKGKYDDVVFKKDKSKPKNKGRYLFYSALIMLIIVASFILGTAFGFYMNINIPDDDPNCEPIQCPQQYQCKPGEVCDFNSCEICSESPVLRIVRRR